ncbi:Hyphally-regulated cell wall protein [Scheffersomyces coipomensis]|uniref:Hyphally-regulated cell wall protein n=1 Tax=Scheffersomyces coipomensis TaxID=1788519 RepID=UPI00315C8175
MPCPYSFRIEIKSSSYKCTVAFAELISQNTTTNGNINHSFSGIDIVKDAFWSIVNNKLSKIMGDVKIAEGGALYISSASSTLGLKVEMNSLFSDIRNDGVMSLNSVRSTINADFTFISKTFTNTGDFFMAASGAQTLIPAKMNVISKNFNNTGFMVFLQNQRNTAKVNLGDILDKSSYTVHNSGQICFYNQIYEQSTAIAGDGCITAYDDSSIFLANPSLEVSKITAYESIFHSKDIIKVAGFGDGNKIGMTKALSGGPVGVPYTYNEETGILVLYTRLGLTAQEFDIGLGYEKEKFGIVDDKGKGLCGVKKGIF